MENSLNEKRKAQKDKDVSNSNLFVKILEAERTRFEYAETTQWLLDDKCDTDLIFVQEKLTEWSEKANPTQKAVLNDLHLSVLRVYTYIESLRILSKTAVSKYVGLEKQVSTLQNKMRLMKLEHQKEILELSKEIENGKKEIEFLSRE